MDPSGAYAAVGAVAGPAGAATSLTELATVICSPLIPLLSKDRPGHRSARLSPLAGIAAPATSPIRVKTRQFPL
jgi:hypothetical protein